MKYVKPEIEELFLSDSFKIICESGFIPPIIDPEDIGGGGGGGDNTDDVPWDEGGDRD